MLEDVKHNKFNALTPEVLKENKQIYTEALDYAFGNSSIKNIAITGIYGAGKSTVWNTYVHEKELSNIITVSLGKYKNNIKDDDDILKEVPLTNTLNSESDGAKNKRSNENQKAEDIGDDNRVERQLINQILSQIESKKIPLSKYGFKSNKSILSICLQSLAVLSIICSILLWIIRDNFISFVNESYKNFNGISLMFLCALLLFVPLFYYLYIFNRGNKFKISKITFKGAEANINDNNSDESVLDRDIKELVYLLRSSNSKIVVFEDLDRYDNASIYTKLRELNFLLNKYVKVNDEKETPIRFIYMLKDSLFYSKNRTKFFDFILPIVPVVDSKTSENELIELLKEVENAPDRSLLADISLYVDDMRLLKNIVNEYIVYSKIIPIGKIDLESNKLFALITLKNIFPNEFDLLQEDKGFVRAIFDELESNRKKIVSNFKQDLEKIDDNIKFINSRIANDKFEAMALMISTDVRPYNNQSKTMSQFLKDWSQNPDNRFDIKYPSGSQYFTYNDFLNRYVLTDNEKKALVEKLPEDFSVEMNKLNLDREKIKKQIKDIEIYSYKELISKMNTEQRDKLFSIDGFDIVESHYFPLIRFLIVDGLLDETYWYYKGNFNVDTSNILKRNDMIYMKGLKEGKALDIFLDVETPNEIISRLKLSDFSRFNILNKKVLKTCLEQKQTENVVAIVDSVDINDKYKDLLKILDEFDLDIVRIYSNMLLKNNVDRLVRTLEFCEDENIDTFKNILISVLTNKTIDLANLAEFKEYIEQNENIISLIPEEEFNVFIDNIRSAGIEFEDVSEANCDKVRLAGVEQVHAYKLNVRNLLFITEAILEKTINYGSLLSEIYNSSQLSSSKEYIEDNFSIVISDYIDENKSEKNYTNSEEILLRILNSDISDEYKLEYVEKNETAISKLTDLQDNSVTTRILDCLLRKNKVKFCSDNIASYWNMIEEYSDDFVEYLNDNLDEDNNEDILKNNISVCNTFINSSFVSDKIFAFVIKYADEPISNVNHKLTQNRVNTLVHQRLIEVTEKNIETLWNNSYYAELISLANYDDDVAEGLVINMLLKYELSDELIYGLVNSDIADGNSMKLIDSIKDSVLVEKINPTKKPIIEYIIKGDLSSVNINYICKSFKMFELKDEFIKSLDDEDKLEDLEDENLNEVFMQYVLSSPDIKLSTKVSLVLTKIKNGLSVNVLKGYISSVKEISELSNVWENKQPLLDNSYKDKVGQALIKFGYVKLRKNKDYPRIMLSRRQNKTKIDDYLL
ncbi:MULTISPECIES: hypothetical protein [Clostridia]|uniref:YobI-like P-loop NTPase domain-containing protein n=1 Tax=Clostridium cadaveris TaxID=1529 RepID=A0A1I2KZB8_9CLOT|nr:MULTISPECIES: hypothetical protein [Bacillota]ERM33662.1 hypothetical protein QUO_3637 [Clostridioides difficile P64]MCE4639114.1 hypothetical protein [Clostridioides difficile]MCR1417676.1 hypothetical protein [Clostridioides difficile]MDI6190194.1 hypothetical protein [Clostridioides difficile]MDI6198671.1 hypothetical protein [Clostridioides difficile]